MKPKKQFIGLILATLLAVWGLAPGSPAMAEDILKYNCSNQVYKAFAKEKVEQFTKATGVKVTVRTASSGSCVYALMNGYCDIASTARALYRRHQDYGYVEIPFCKDPIAVIANKECGVHDLTEDQLQDIFSGGITNWKEVGGADLPILVIIPSKDTAANKNFRRQVMKHKDIKHDFMAYDSTMVIEAVKYFPCGAVSFISRGAVLHEETIKRIRINGKRPRDPDYPYYQIFNYITKGEPKGPVKQFIDFAFSEKGKEIIVNNGMIPIKR